jgi:hypothetical protein
MHDETTARTPMKILTVILTAGLLAASALPAQARPKMTLGLNGGLTLASMYGAGIDTLSIGMNKGYRPGLDAGVTFTFAFSELLGVSTELRYAERGVRIAGTGGDFLEFETGSIDIPLFLSLSLPRRVVTPYALIGPQMSINASATVGGNIGGKETPKTGWTAALLPRPSMLDFGFAAAVGLAVKAGPGRALVEYRFSMGFQTLDGSTSGPAKEMKSIAPATILAGYAIDL